MSYPHIVETVTATSMAELLARRDAARTADLVELRVDGVRDLDVMAAVAGRTRPVILTCRPTWEGGRWEGDERDRRRILADAVAAGAEYVDIERRAGWVPALHGTSTRLIVSEHDFRGIPSDVGDRIRDMRRLGAQVVKISVTAEQVTDTVRLRDAVRGSGDTDALVCIAMGAAGQVTRLLPFHFGSCWTYAGDAAPGQISTTALANGYRVRSQTATTRLFGVVGAPIGHSASPAMHNAACAAARYDAVYVPVLAATIDEAAQFAEALVFDGLSVTAPLKHGWLDRADVTPDDAACRALGVINTLRREDGRWRARNFDVAGFLDPLDELPMPLEGSSALILGAGGAARAVGWALRQRGATVSISARRRSEGARVASELGAQPVDWPAEGEWPLVVNATPAGTWPRVDEAPLALSRLRAAVAYDLVYNPEETSFLRGMREGGARTIGGLDMLVGQAARQFEWWTDHPADRDVMRAAAQRFIGEQAES